MLNLQAIQRAAVMIFWKDAREVFGEHGVTCLKGLLNSIREFFQAVPPDQLSTTFIFIHRMRDDGVNEIEDGMERIATALSLDSLAGHRKRMEDASAILIDVRKDGRFDLVAPTVTPSLETLSQTSLVFVNKGGVDRFFIGGRSSIMPQLAPGAPSNFAVATVADLEEALEKYRQVAENVSCPILEHIWIGCRKWPSIGTTEQARVNYAPITRVVLEYKNPGRRLCSLRTQHRRVETGRYHCQLVWFENACPDRNQMGRRFAD